MATKVAAEKKKAAAQVCTDQHGSALPSIHPHPHEEPEEEEWEGSSESEEPHLERPGGENVDRDYRDCEARELVPEAGDGLPEPQQEEVAVPPQGGRRGHDGRAAWAVPIRDSPVDCS